MANTGVECGDDFILRLENARIEVKAKFSRAKALLEERENTLLAQLNDIEDDYLERQQRDVTHKNELIATREHLHNTLKGNDSRTTLQAMLVPLEAEFMRLQELEHQFEIFWNRENELEDLLKDMGTIRIIKLDKKANNEMSYKMKKRPLLTGCKFRENSTLRGEFKWPTVIEVHPNTNLYVLDPLNNRVQVLDSSCKFLFSFSENMNNPAGVCFYKDQVYVTQNQTQVLNIYSTKGGFIRTAGKGKDFRLKSPLRICSSQFTGNIYICEQDNRVQILNEDLSFNNFIRKLVSPREVKVTREAIFILDKQSLCLTSITFNTNGFGI